MAGVTIRVKIVANDNPKTIVDARPAHCEAKGPPISISAPSRSMEMPIARGNKPKPVVNVVRNTGRSLCTPVCTIISRKTQCHRHSAVLADSTA